MWLQRPGDRADQPVATERDGDLAGRGCVRGQLPRVLEASRQLDVVLEPEPGQGQLDSVRAPAPSGPPPAEGLTISDSFTSPA